MLYSLVNFVLDAVAGLFAGVMLLRFWMQLVRVRPPHQIAQFTYQLSDWLIKPLRKIIPGIGGIDWASLLGAYLVALLSTAIKMWLVVDTVLLSTLLVAAVSVLEWVIYGWTALLILEVIFSWVNPHAPLAPFVRALNAPLLGPIRRIIPLLGGLDVSPMVLFLLLQMAGKILAYAAATAGMALL